MKRSVFAVLISVAGMGFGSPPAQAEVGFLTDHLLCYRMKDKFEITAAVDMMTAVQPEFIRQGCTLIRPLEFCVPAVKQNVQPPASLDLPGQALEDDYICYLAKCTGKVFPPDQSVVDQFGTHLHRRYRPTKVCVPAKKRPVDCRLFGASACAGACPNASDDCRFDPATQSCNCQPEPCEGRPDQHGTCGGTCTNSNERCLPGVDANNNRVCMCQPPPPPPCGVIATTGECGGACPNPTDKCVALTTGDCRCLPTSHPCEQIAGTTACGGDCPAATDKCVRSPSSGLCECQPDPQPCGLIPGTTVCDGSCPIPTDICVTTATGCSCRPPTCDRNPFTGVCGGDCTNPGEQCLFDAANDICRCQPTPCGGDTAASGTCSGACATGTCQFVTATNSCRCQ